MDLATAQEHLDGWLTVEAALRSGQMYTLPEVSVTRVDARTVLQRINYWQRVVDSLTARAAGVSSAVTLASFS